MEFDPFDLPHDDPWGDEAPPLLRRPMVRGTITILVIVSFVMLTLMSTCSPRTTRIGPTTTTTLQRTLALNP